MAKKKSIILVANKDTFNHAEFLATLITQKEENDAESQDGSAKIEYSASVMTDKEYKNNRINIAASPDSTNYVIFIGSFKEEMDYLGHGNSVFHEYGMNIKWLGKRAVLVIEKNRFKELKNEYKEFINFAKAYDLNFEEQDFSKGSSTLGFGPIYYPIVMYQPIPEFVVTNGVKLYKRHQIKNDVFKQKYQCLIKVFYKDWLKKFLEN